MSGRPPVVPVLPPASAADLATRGPDWAAWAQRLPRLAADLLVEWELSRDGAPLHGRACLVLPVLTRDGVGAVLKLGFPDEESEHEPLALQHWGGRGAVRLMRAAPSRRAMLLERLGEEDLGVLRDIEACEVVAGLYGRLHVPAPPQLRRLSDQAARWAGRLADLDRGAPAPRRLVEQAAGLARDLAQDPATDGTMVHGDLHHANVLAAAREPWLAIDPRPLSGDPHVEPAAMLAARWDEVVASSMGVREAVRQRFFALVDGAGLEEDRARAWVVVRAMVRLCDLADLASTSGGADRDRLTACVAIAKAVQD